MTGSERARAAIAIAALASLTVFDRVAFADATPAERETARELMANGRQKRDQGDLAAALKSFEAADALMHVPTTGLEVARTRISLGQLVEGRDALRRILVVPLRAEDPAPFRDARSLAERLDAELADRIPAIKIVIRAAPSTPSVTVDGTHIPPEAIGIPFRLNPGHHEIAGKIGSTSVVKQVDLKDLELSDVILDFSGTATSGLSPSQNPRDDSPVPNISHSGPNRTLTYVGFAAGGVGLAVGAVTGILAIGAKNSAIDGGCVNNQCPPKTYGDLDRANTLAPISTIAFVVGGLGIGVGIVSILMSSSTSRASTVGTSPYRVSPWIGAGNAGLRGSF
jgi:hypothetical protein